MTTPVYTADLVPSRVRETLTTSIQIAAGKWAAVDPEDDDAYDQASIPCLLLVEFAVNSGIMTLDEARGIEADAQETYLAVDAELAASDYQSSMIDAALRHNAPWVAVVYLPRDVAAARLAERGYTL